MNSINEVDIKSIVDLVDMAANGTGILKDEKGNRPNHHYLGGSISNYTKNLIMTFPCMCDDSLSASTASMISRANERNIITMLHMLFSSINMSTSADAVDIIKGIHHNIKTNYNIDDYIDMANTIAGESAKLTPMQEKTIIESMMKTIKEAKSFPTDSLLEDSSLMDFEVRSAGKTISVREDAKQRTKSPDTATTTVDSNGQTKTTTSFKYRAYNQHDFSTQDNPTLDDLEYEKKKEELRQLQKNNNTDDSEERYSRNQKDKTELIQKRLLDADVKKANEMQPALMIVSYNQLGQSGNLIGKSSFVAGVKSRLIPVESQDIIDRIFAKNKTKINFKNFIRATTGEISFVKDFLLCINQAKIDAKNASKKGIAATMWKTLENRSIKNNLNRFRKAGNDASAITVLVVSQETVNALNKYYHIDLSKVKVAKDIMETYNLMGIIIADDSLEVAKFLYAGNDMWDQQAYSFLEKEGKDKSYKDVVNLLNKNLL